MNRRSMDGRDYVHGHSTQEAERLTDQARTLEQLLHHDTRYPSGLRVLEAGCGVGAQTAILARNSPETMFISVDLSEDSLRLARDRIRQAGITNVSFLQGDIHDLPFPRETFDHVFVCFLLEHLPDPVLALDRLKDLLKTMGSITVIEGDHGSAHFHPGSSDGTRTIQCLVDLQRQMHGNALIGRALYPLLKAAGFRDIRVSPRTAYVDESSPPEQVEGFRKTFIGMIEGAREPVLAAKMVDEETWARGIRDLYRASEPGGTFCYTFFKGTAIK
jgi:SAM-dependent methyltransferase